jgi:ligand-binding sensor domain-containing protein
MPFSHGTAAAVFDLQKDNQGRIWIGTLGDGLKCYDPVSEKLTEYRAKVGKREQLINNYILQMEISPDGSMLFVGTSMGLACLDIPSGSWTKVLGTDSILSGQMIRCIKYTNQVGLWAGTSKGAYHYDIATKKLTQYT